MEGSNSGGSSHGLGSKTWFSRRLRSSKRSTEDHSSAHKSSPTIADSSFTDLPALYPSESRSFSEQSDNARQLHQLVQKMRSAPAGPNHVDAAYKEISKMFEKASGLCSAVLQDELKPLQRLMSNATQTQVSPRDRSVEPRSPVAQLDSRSSFSGRSLGEIVSGGGGTRTLPFASDAWLSPIRDWKNCVETVGEAFRANLAETYMSYEKDATPEMLESLFTSKKFRREAVHRMRNASVTRVLSANPEFFPKYEIRFRNYEKLKLELGNIRQILQLGESGISPSRTILEYPVAPRGDAVLEFANLHPDANGDEPVLRFRVSPHVLAETSPIFARMFSGHGYSLHVHDSEDITSHLPSPPSRYYCSDGTEAWLYRMPQLETNQHQSMEILMHAAHMHNAHVPREVTFDQFVAIAQCSIQYKSTSPLELMVEHRWLPQWMHKGADDMPDGLLIISYAFGARGLFTRTSKSAILNLLDEKDLNRKPWPQKIKDKVWAVRNAKVAQLYNCCTAMLQEYLPQPACEPTIEPDLTSPTAGARTGINAAAMPPKTSMPMVSTPRCPKGSHWCDAANLGWLMLVFNNMGIMDSVLKSSTLNTIPDPPFQPKSLVQTVDLLRSIPPAIAPVHRGGVCDPIPAFRTMIADIYNTVNGLTLHDVSGKSHGWALSKNMTTEPQIGEAIGLGRMAAPDNSYSVAAEFPEKVLFKILCEISDLQDLHSAARVNRAFYETYKTHELHLIRHILRVGRVRSGSLVPRLPMHASNAEDKSLLSDLNQHPPEVDDAPTAATSDAESASDESDDELPIDTTRFSTVQQPPEYQTMDSSPVGSIRRHEQAEDDEDTASEGDHRDQTPEAEPMTEEEAFRIIWPEGYDNATVTPNTPTAAVQEGLREKFRINDQSFIDGLEDKTLLPVEGKRMHHQALAGRARQAPSGGSRA